jgi:TP901 family phage tail tape measure protein
LAEPQGAVLGNAVGYVDINTSGVSTNLNRAKQDFNSFIQSTGSMMQSWGASIAGFGQNLTLWTAPVALAVGTGLNLAADFDSVLTEIQARTSLTAEAMEQVRQTALQLGADTAFSSQQAADAFLNLLTAGLSVQDALSTLPQVLTAAAAGGMDLATAADLTTSIMASFNLSAADSTAIIDAMSRASAASPASMNEIGIAMKDVGGLAQMFNLSLDETAAVLAIFAQNGIRGAEAGTQLRSLLLNLSSPTAATTAAWEALGTSLYNADGTMRNLDDVLADIRVGLDRLPVEQQNEIISQLAGSYGIVGFNALLASDGIAAMQGTMAEQSAAADVAAAMMDTFKMTIDSLMGTIQTFWITVLTPFMNNVLKPLANQVIDIVNGMTAWAAANEPLVQIMMTMLTGLIALGPTLMLVGRGIQLLGFFVTVLANPFAWLAAAVGGLAYLFREQLGAALRIVGDAFGVFQTKFTETGDFLKAVLAGVTNSIVNFVIKMGMSAEVASYLLRGIQQIIVPMREMFAAIGAGVPILDAFQHMLYDVAGPDVASSFGFLKDIVTDALTKIRVGFQFFLLFIRNGASVITAFKATLGALFGTNPVIVSFLNDVFGAFDQFSSNLDVIKTRISKFFDTAITTFGKFAGAVHFALNTFFGLLSNGVAPLIAFQSTLITVFGSDSIITQFAISAIGRFMQLKAAIDTFFRLLNSGQSILFSLKGAFATAFGNTIVFENFMDNLEPIFLAFNQMKIAFNQVKSVIDTFFALLNAGVPALDALQASIRAVFGSSDWLDGLISSFNRIKSAVEPAFRQISLFIQNTITRIRDFIGRLFNMGASAEDSLNPVVRFLSFLGETIMTTFERVMSGITVFFASLNQGSSFVYAFWAALYTVFGAEMAGQIQGFVFGIGQAIQSFIDGVTSVWNFLQGIFSWIVENVTLQDLLVSIGIAFAAINAPIIAAGLAFAGLVVAVSMFRQAWETNWGGIQDKTFAVITTIGQLGILIPYWLNQASIAAQQLWTLLTIGFAFVVVKFLELMLWIGEQLGKAWTTLSQIGSLLVMAFTTAWTAITQFVSLIWLGLQALVAWLGLVWDITWAAIVTFFVGLWNAVVTGFDNFKNGIQAAFQWVADNVLAPARTAWDGVVGFFAGLWNSISTGIESFKTGLADAFNWIKTNVIDPIVTAVQGLLDLLGGVSGAAQGAATAATGAIGGATSGLSAAGSMGGQIAGGLASGQYNIGEVGAAFGGAIGKLFGFAQGINYLPNDMIIQAHKGEAIIPEHLNPYNPNAQQNGMGGGITINGDIILPGVTNYQQGLEAGRGVTDGVRERWRQLGGGRNE